MYYGFGALLEAGLLVLLWRWVRRPSAASAAPISRAGSPADTLPSRRERQRQNGLYFATVLIPAAVPILLALLQSAFLPGVLPTDAVYTDLGTAEWIFLTAGFVAGIPAILLSGVFRDRRTPAAPSPAPRRSLRIACAVIWALALPTVWMSANAYRTLTPSAVVVKPASSFSAVVYTAADLRDAQAEHTATATRLTLTMADGRVLTVTAADADFDLAAWLTQFTAAS